MSHKGMAMMIFGIICLAGSACKLWINQKDKKRENEAFVSPRLGVIKTVS